MSSADFRSLSQYNEPLIRSPSIYSSIGSGIYLPQGTPLHGGVFVLANTILGAGMLGLPFAFAACGYLMGTLMLTGFGACATGALVMLSEAADHVGRPAWKAHRLFLRGVRWLRRVSYAVCGPSVKHL